MLCRGGVAGMVRTQVQLTEEQAIALKQLAARRGVSLAELVRNAIDRLLADADRRERRARALSLLGRYQDSGSDVARQHDRYLVEEDGH